MSYSSLLNKRVTSLSKRTNKPVEEEFVLTSNIRNEFIVFVLKLT
jgi:hypothetical protein